MNFQSKAVCTLGLAGLLMTAQTAWSAPNRVEVETAYLSRDVHVPATVVIPLAGADQGLPLVVMAHGHGATREEAGAFRQMASELAKAGIASIRMDFSGCGENPDPFSENNLGNMVQDILAAKAFALNELPVDPERVAFLGYSMGSRVMVMATEDHSPAALALWAPVGLNGAAAMYTYVGGERAWQQLRQEAERDGAANFITPWGDEQTLGLQWFIDLEQSNPEDVIGEFDGPILILHGADDEAVPAENGRALAQGAGQGAAVETHFIDGARHGLGFYERNADISGRVIQVTTDFLVRQLLKPASSSSPDS